MARNTHHSRCLPAGVLSLKVLALVLVGCDKAAEFVGNDTVAFNGNTTLTDIAEVIRAFNVTVA